MWASMLVGFMVMIASVCQLRSKGHCERYYRTYGNVAPGPSGAPQQGYFYDLPECQAWLEAREALRVSRSRP